VTSPHGLSLAEKHFRFPQFVDNLFDCIALSRHFDLPPFPDPNITVGSVFGGQVKKHEPGRRRKMTTYIYEGRLDQMRPKIRNQWNLITEADLDRVNGYKEQLIAVLQKKYGYNRSTAEGLLETFGLRENGVLANFPVNVKR